MAISESMVQVVKALAFAETQTTGNELELVRSFQQTLSLELPDTTCEALLDKGREGSTCLDRFTNAPCAACVRRADRLSKQ